MKRVLTYQTWIMKHAFKNVKVQILLYSSCITTRHINSSVVSSPVFPILTRVTYSNMNHCSVMRYFRLWHSNKKWKIVFAGAGTPTIRRNLMIFVFVNLITRFDAHLFWRQELRQYSLRLTSRINSNWTLNSL